MKENIGPDQFVVPLDTVQPISLKILADEILRDHHIPTRAWLDKAQACFSASAKVLPDRQMLDKLGMAFRSMAMTMHMHMEKEEQVLFPMFQRMQDGFNTEKFCGGIENPIHMMENEHKELDIHFERFRKITDGYRVLADSPPALRELFDTLKALEADLKIHSEKEECLLFPAAVKREKALVAQSTAR